MFKTVPDHKESSKGVSQKKNTEVRLLCYVRDGLDTPEAI